MSGAFLSMSNTGHNGSMTTIHANDSRSALTRMAGLVQQQVGGERQFIMEELNEVVDIGIHVEKKNKKRVATITRFYNE